MSSQYDVEVRLSTVGTSELTNNLKNVEGVMRSMSATLNDADAGTKRLSTTFRQTTSDGEKYSISMRQLSDAQRGAVGSTMSLTTALGGITAAFGMATAGLFSVYEAFKKVLEPGVQFNSFLEMNKLALAAMQLTFGQYVDAQGKAIDQTRQWSDATAQAVINQELLVKQSLSSAVSIRDLANVFQMMYGAMIAGGAKTQQEMVTFAGVTADMATVMGTSYDRAARQMTLALLGVTRTTGQLGALLRSMGIDNATLQSWRDQGIIVEELTKKLHAFVEMQPKLQETWKGITTNMETAWQQLTGAISKDAFGGLKTGLNDLLHFVIDFNTGKLSSAMQEMTGTLSAGISGAFDVALSTIRSVFKTIDSTIAGSGGTWLSVFKSLADLMVFFAENAGKALLILSESVIHPAEMMDVAWSKALQHVLDDLASLLDGFGKIAASPFGFLLGGVGVSGEIAKTLAGTLRNISAGFEAELKIGDTATNRLAKGFKEIDANARLAYEAIEKIGNSTWADKYNAAFKSAFGAPSDKYAPNAPEKDTSKIDEAIRKYKEWMALLEQKLETGGLVGLDAALEKNKLEWMKNQKAIEDHTAAIQKNYGIANVFAGILTVMNDAWRQAMDTRAIEDAEKKYLDAYAKIGKAAGETAIEQIEASRQAKQQQIVDFTAIAIANARTQDQIVAAITLAGEKIKQLNAKSALETKTIEDEQAGRWDDYYKDLVKKATNAGKGMAEAMQESLSTTAEKAYKNATDIASGIQAGLLKIVASTKYYGQIIADTMTAVWNDLGQAFETGFYDIITGKFDSLKDVLKSLWDSIEKDFAKMLAQMLERWLITGSIMGGGTGAGAGNTGGLLGSLLNGNGQNQNRSYEQAQGFEGPPSQGGGGSQLSGYLALAGAAYMGISAIIKGAGKNTQQYSVGGQQFSGDFGGNAKFGDFIGPAAAAVIGVYLAAAVGVAIVPVVGWIAAALILVVGAILSIINGPKELKVPLNTSVMGDNSAVGQALMQSYGQTYGALANINRAGGGSGADLSKYMAANLAGTKSWQPYLHAGSGDDITKDAEYFFKVVWPRINIQQAFGQTWTGRYHGDQAGGPPGAEGIAGIGGVPIMVSGSFDPNAPIPKMLTGLGLTAKQITGIAMQIDVRDPDKFLEWLGRVVNVVAGFKATVANLSKNWVDIQHDMQVAQESGATQTFKVSTQNIIDLAGEIGNYVGDEQLTKMEELQKASDDYYASAEKAVEALITMMQKVDEQASAFQDKINNYYKTPDWLAADRTGRMSGFYGGALTNATSATDVQKIWDQFMQDAADQLNYLISLLNQAKAGMKTASDLAKKFSTILEDASKETTVYTLWTDIGDLQVQYAAAMKLSGQAQIDALTAINASAQDVYNTLMSIVQGIQQAEESLHKSIANQIWENEFSTKKTPAEKLAMINTSIGDTMSGIGSLTTAGAVNDAAASVQAMINRYLSMFAADDPNRAAAVAQANAALRALDAATHAQLKALEEQAKKDADAAKKIMDETRDAFHDAMVQATADITALGLSVDAFRAEVDAKLMGWATEITDQMSLVATALVAAMKSFTSSLEGTPDNSTGGKGHEPPDKLINRLGASAGDGASALTDFTLALHTATNALTGA